MKRCANRAGKLRADRARSLCALGAGRALAALAILSCAPAQALELSLEYNPRLEAAWGGSRLQAGRGLLKSSARATHGAFQLFAEAFAEKDLASAASADRRASSTAALQELYAEYKSDALIVRAGRQAARWSESWTIPSLDLWTGRRLNRLFLDPLPEQLVHSTGLLAVVPLSQVELSAFYVTHPAESEMPAPFPETLAADGPRFGTRARARLGGFDVSGVFAHAPGSSAPGSPATNTLGVSANYALDALVPKAELGRDDQGAFFATAGADLFPSTPLGEGFSLSVLPQLTHFRATDAAPTQQLAYCALRLSNEKHSVELQAYRLLESSGDQYLAALYKRSFSQGQGVAARLGLELTAYAQNYEGAPGTLFGVFHQITGGSVVGIRLESHGLL